MSIILRHLSTVGLNRILVFILVLWLVILLFAALPMLNTHLPVSSDTRTTERLNRALTELDQLRKQNIQLHEIFKDMVSGDLKGDQKEAIENFQARLTKVEHSYTQSQDLLGYVYQKEEPNTQYEQMRRRIATNTLEFWRFIQSEITKAKKLASEKEPDLLPTLEYILSLGVEHKRSLLHDIDQLAEVDGYAIWREKEANELSELVQARFHYLQNPKDCKTAKKLVCSLNKGCGYGCQLHHAAYCFMVAYGTKRTFVLKSGGWKYNKGGWEEIFKPLSDTCTDPTGESRSSSLDKEDIQVIHLPIIDSLSPRPPYLPLAVPEDLAPRLIRLHGDPIVWWVGQVLKYLIRPQPNTAQMLQKAITNMGFQRPIVGVHIRRTDKVGTEAAFHSIEEYMAEVEEYFNVLELKQKVEKRRVYLATDDPSVLTQTRQKYPNYEILGDPEIAKSAAVSSRYTSGSLSGIIIDIHLLSMSDFIVCTFSSQVCRVAYELMQNYFPDAADRFRSLDDIYYYGGQSAHNRIAVLPHDSKTRGGIDLAVGDLVGVAGNHWNGFSKGRNLRTNQIGLYPSFKVKDKVETAKFPTYSDMNKQNSEEN